MHSQHPEYCTSTDKLHKPRLETIAVEELRLRNQELDHVRQQGKLQTLTLDLKSLDPEAAEHFRCSLQTYHFFTHTLVQDFRMVKHYHIHPTHILQFLFVQGFSLQ